MVILACKSIVLCKCSGKYIDIYFSFKITFRFHYGSAAFHPGHGSGLSLSASLGYPHVQIPG